MPIQVAVNLLPIFRTTFSKKYLWRAASGKAATTFHTIPSENIRSRCKNRYEC